MRKQLPDSLLNKNIEFVFADPFDEPERYLTAMQQAGVKPSVCWINWNKDRLEKQQGEAA